MAKRDAERIRQYLNDQVRLERGKREKTVRFRSGDVHKALGLENRMPNVCQVLKGRLFRETCRVEMARYIDSPPSGQGANLIIEFRLL